MAKEKSQESKANPMVNCVQQKLYPGQTGALEAESGGTSPEAEPTPAGWWAFQFDPTDPTALTMLVTLVAKEQSSGGPTYFSSRLNANEMQLLYQWLALHMNQPKGA